MPDTVIVIASGDLRLSANQKCWPAQARAEEAVMNAIRREGHEVRRGHACDPEKGHGFIDSQKYGMEVFREHSAGRRRWWWWKRSGSTAITCCTGCTPTAGPILTVANWSGEWPGLVGMLNLNASLTKAGVHYSTLWSEDFTDEFFLRGLRQWLAGRAGGARHSATCSRSAQFRLPARGRSDRRAAGRRTAARQSHHGHLRRRLHGHVQRHHPRRTAARRPACSRSG